MLAAELSAAGRRVPAIIYSRTDVSGYGNRCRNLLLQRLTARTVGAQHHGKPVLCIRCFVVLSVKRFRLLRLCRPAQNWAWVGYWNFTTRCLAVTGGGRPSISECGRLSQPSWLWGKTSLLTDWIQQWISVTTQFHCCFVALFSLPVGDCTDCIPTFRKHFTFNFYSVRIIFAEDLNNDNSNNNKYS